MQKRIIIVDDNLQIREGFRDVLESVEDYTVINIYGNCEDAIANLEIDRPNVVLMDIGLPNMDGIEGTTLIKKKFPNCIVLVITVFEDSDRVFKSLCAGASGYIVKTANLNKITEVIEEALAGGAPMSFSISKMVVESFRKHQDSPLSDRESQVLQYISEGKSYSKIAQELYALTSKTFTVSWKLSAKKLQFELPIRINGCRILIISCQFHSL